MSGDQFVNDTPAIRLPRPAAEGPGPGAFLACPLLAVPGANSGMLGAVLALHAFAFAEALAVVQPSLPERDLAGAWN